MLEEDWHEGSSQGGAGVVEEAWHEGSCQDGAALLEGLLGAGSKDSGLKTVGQQNLARRRHRSPHPPHQFVGRFNYNTATVFYLNSAINLILSSLLFNDTFLVIKSLLKGPLVDQLHLICGSYPGQVRRLNQILES